MSATLQFSSSSSSLDLTPAEPVGGSMRTAADLLASMISTSMATPLNKFSPSLQSCPFATRLSREMELILARRTIRTRTPPLRSSPVVPHLRDTAQECHPFRFQSLPKDLQILISGLLCPLQVHLLPWNLT
ncbi:hypothetical protein Pst134EB_020486 [Puccinia striiformis f. sp. tritici]|nr:hypothetical protein Pst134EB_020486 [Puccinia striiformis f. sp. tritici]